LKRLIKTDTTIAWLPKPGECRLYLTDELPPSEQCSTAFGFVFVDEKVLLTRLRDRDWDIPGGFINPGETPVAAAIREVWEETYAKVEVVELIGIQEVECLGPKPPGYRWPYPISVQVYYLCRLIELCPFEANAESVERQFFEPAAARSMPTMNNHDLIYEAGLQRIQSMK
jgi:ADP-ribose pyrophosphatase YjhB (NUDIX family)